ncbi:MAG TPA: YihY/virulence factor BrkB family protein [Flavobacteriales bacterium]|nr:YihY/virulence factor BrkB family protein [Flavobacteriales bacterium]
MLKRLWRKVLYSRANRSLISWAQRIRFPGSGGFSVYHIARFFFLALAEGRLTTRASAIAFKLFLAFFPIIILLLTLIPYIPVADFQEKLLHNFQAMLPPAVFDFIHGLLHDLVVRKHGGLLSVSFITGLYFASNGLDAILMGFRGSYHIERWHSPLMQRLLSLGLLLALTVMMVVAMALLTFSNHVIRMLPDLGIRLGDLEHFGLFAAKWSITVVLITACIGLLYSAGDPGARRFRIFTPGAVLAVILTLLLSQALAFFFARITDYNALYGSLGAILAVQLWLYFNMLVLLIGFELNTSISKARSERTDTLRLKSAKQ